MKIDNMKEQETQGMENLRKNYETEMQNKMEGQSSRLEQAEDRISELKDEMVIKGKTKKLLIKQLKTCEKKMQELTDCIKRPNLRIMGIKEGEEVQAKGMCNIFNKIITENFPNLENLCPYSCRNPPEHQTDLTKTELLYNILSLKQQVQRLEKEYCRQ
jgi:predicted nuclease with TOPRIM domain